MCLGKDTLEIISEGLIEVHVGYNIRKMYEVHGCFSKKTDNRQYTDHCVRDKTQFVRLSRCQKEIQVRASKLESNW